MGQDSDTQRLTHDIEDTRTDLSRNVDALTEKVSPSRVVERRVERTRTRFATMKESVMGSASGAKDSVMGSATGAKDSVRGSASGTGSSLSDTAGTAKQKARGNPLAAGLLAFGTGWLVSSLLPASEKEAQAAQQLEDAAKEHGQPLKEQASQVGRDVGDTMKEKASTAADEVKSTAQESSQRVKEEGQSSAENVKGQAPTSS